MRHTGIALLNEGGDLLRLDQIDREEKSVLEVLPLLRVDFFNWISRTLARARTAAIKKPPVIGFERQLTGDVNGWLQMMIQMAIWEALHLYFGSSLVMVAPYPRQLKKYGQEMQGLKMDTKGEIRRTYFEKKERFGYTGPRAPSSHQIEAHILALMAKDVVAGNWSFQQRPTSPILAPWRLVNGSE